MGLDATVYCDCFERGRLRSQPPGNAEIQVESDGSLCRANDTGRIEDDLVFDRWLYESACEHPNGVLLHHRIGNTSLVALLRSELASEAEQFPIILRKVIYDGTHAGDSIAVAELPVLHAEVERLQSFRCRDRKSVDFLVHFTAQMQELVETAMAIRKPISF